MNRNKTVLQTQNAFAHEHNRPASLNSVGGARQFPPQERQGYSVLWVTLNKELMKERYDEQKTNDDKKFETNIWRGRSDGAFSNPGFRKGDNCAGPIAKNR